MAVYKLSKDSLAHFTSYIVDAIIAKKEFKFLEDGCKRYPCGNDYYKVVDYTLDSYNLLKGGMPVVNAKKTAIINGLEFMLITHVNNLKKSIDTQFNEFDE